MVSIPTGNVILLRPLQFSKALAPIRTRLAGSRTSWSFEHPENAFSPISIMLSGSESFFNEVFDRKALLPILVTTIPSKVSGRTASAGRSPE